MKEETFDELMRDFYRWEQNVTIESFWDSGWYVGIGDHTNGFRSREMFAAGDFKGMKEFLREELDKIAANEK